MLNTNEYNQSCKSNVKSQQKYLHFKTLSTSLGPTKFQTCLRSHNLLWSGWENLSFMCFAELYAATL